MKLSEFICNNLSDFPEKGEVTWNSPSNIALVKYWGKKPIQIPSNPSISFTLKNCFTTTKLSFERSQTPSIKLIVAGKENDSFLKKINTFLDRIQIYCPYIKDYSLTINTENTFPHSSGIASSASGFSALSLCILSIEKQVLILSDEFFYKKASFISRLGSGSASRSIYGPISVWGEHPLFEDSNDEYAIPYTNAHKVFKNYQDTILIVDKGIKQISSTVGHQLMDNHPFASNRFIQADHNLKKIKKILAEGNLTEFNDVIEKEALTLHAMMMTSEPYFMLFKPNTLQIINKVWTKRKETNLPISVTLDAGANVHLLYPEEYKNKTMAFIREELIGYCENQQYICDEVGNGPLLKKEHYA